MTNVIQYPSPEKHPRKRVLTPGLLKPASRRTPYKKAFGADRDGLLRKSDFKTKEHAQTIRTMPIDEREEFFVALEAGKLGDCYRMYAAQLFANSRVAADAAMAVMKQYEMLRALDPAGARRFLTLVRDFERELNDKLPKTEYEIAGYKLDDDGEVILPVQAAHEPRDDVLDLAHEHGLDLKQTCLLSLRLKGGPAFNKYGHATCLTGNGKSKLLAALDGYGGLPSTGAYIVEGDDEMTDDLSDDPAHYCGGDVIEYDNHGFYYVGPDDTEGLAA